MRCKFSVRDQNRFVVYYHVRFTDENDSSAEVMQVFRSGNESKAYYCVFLTKIIR